MTKKNELIEYPSLPESARTTLPSAEVLELIPAELVETLEVFVFEKSDSGVKIAAVAPSKPAVQHFAKERFGENTEWFQATPGDIARILKNLKRDFKSEILRLTNTGEQNGNIIEIVDRIVNFALVEKASDVHVEPLRQETVVRFRLDGMLRKVLAIPKIFHNAIVSRFKILSNLKIDEYRRPQDGRIELEKLPDTSIRISTVPTLYGEKVALRILDDSHKELSLRRLGFSEKYEHILLRNIEKPFGMIVTSGPTGSGKSTTLYGLLNLLRKDGINISTLEDPIEYALSGVNQIQINPRVELSFASGLRSLLRQDPDVIMVGEIRDSETAVMATNAALTGHLVLTTIHTNDAPSAFTRFLEMQVEDFVVGSVVNLVIAQRLVRKACDACAENRVLDKPMLKKVHERQDVVSRLEKLGLSLDALAKRQLRAGKGCPECLETGYTGRIGMFELLELTKEIHDAILEHAPADRLRAIAEKTGFCDMIEDGLQKALDGKTTFEEVMRVTRNA